MRIITWYIGNWFITYTYVSYYISFVKLLDIFFPFQTDRLEVKSTDRRAITSSSG